MKKTKILIVVTPINNRGGIIRRLKLWTKYFSKIYQLKIVCHTFNSSVLSVLSNEGAEIVNVSGLDKIGRLSFFPGVYAIQKEIRSYDPDVVISMFLWGDFLTSCALKYVRTFIKKQPTHLIHIAGDPVPVWDRSFSEFAYRLIVGFSFKCCDRIITICNHDAELVNKKYNINNKKISVVPIGIEVPEKRYVKTSIHNPFVFGVISRLDKEKNVHSIVDCFHKVKHSLNEDVRLFIYGNGIEMNNIKKIVYDLDIDSEVVFKGHVDNPYDAFDTIDCLLIYSASEGTPRSILEGAARGVPTIANDVGGIPEIILNGKTGFIVRDTETLKQKMIKMVIDKNNTLKMGNRAVDYIGWNRLIEHEIIKFNSLL